MFVAKTFADLSIIMGVIGSHARSISSIMTDIIVLGVYMGVKRG